MQEGKGWGGPRPGAGRPPSWIKVKVEDWAKVEELADCAADLLVKAPDEGLTNELYSALQKALEAVEEAKLFEPDN